MRSECVKAGAPLSEASAAVIFVHGRGSTPEEILGLTRFLEHDRVAYLAPRASNGQWYPHRFIAPLAQNEPSLSEALHALRELITLCAEAGVAQNRVALVGFSQGACLSLEYAYRFPRRFGFVAALSGALIGPLDTPRPDVDLEATPVLVACAENDAHIPIDHVHHSAGVLKRSRAEVTRQIFPGASHTLFPDEITWLRAHTASLAQS